ncbi:MAG: double zinc ribbon domain-containing protein [Candidatus Heimdallarchaeota archaeon]
MSEKEEEQIIEDDEEVSENKTAKDDFNICSNCKEPSPVDFLFCRTCGQAFVDKITCRKCQSNVPIYNTYCQHCGAPMKETHIYIRQNLQHFYTPNNQQLRSLTSENQEIHYRTQYQIKIQQRKNSARIVGIVFLVLSLLSLGSLILTLFTLSSEAFTEAMELYGYDDLLGIESFYAMIIGFMLPQVVVLLISGIGLLVQKEDTKPWKKLYHVLRITFIGFSTIMALIVLITAFGWIFYNPSYENTMPQAIWLFYVFFISTPMKMKNLYLLLFGIFALCIVLLILPPIVKSIKQTIKKNMTGKTLVVNEAKLKTEQPEIVLEEKSMIFFTSKNEEFRAIRKRKGPMPAIFTKIKNTPLIKSMELLGAQFLVSYVLSFIFVSAAAGDGVDLATIDPFEYVIQVTWAGVFEEISFRLALIGIPMIIVISVRLYLQSVTKKDQDILTKTEETMYNRPKRFAYPKQPKLSYKDILLAIRGKYKIIGFPEWILVGISALLFGLAHWSGWTGGWGAWKIVQAGVTGIFLGYAFVKYGIESAIFIHISNNLLVTLVLFTTVFVPNTAWLGFLSTIMIPLLLILGIMKAISWIINLVYRYKIIKMPNV